ncbi:MAG TPA: class I SAM-dependent methyltransferase [Actinoplanes sp.]
MAHDHAHHASSHAHGGASHAGGATSRAGGASSHAHGASSDADGHMAEILDLDAEVLSDHHAEVIAWAGTLVPERSRIVDLGAGTGTGTLALARHLPGAEVTAVDMDENLLARLRRHAAEAGVGDRVRTVRADLDGTWPDLGPADLVWAAKAMHHLADPARALAQVRDTLRPRGHFLITEIDSFPRFLADPAGIALEDRLHAAQDRMREEAGLHMGVDWGARLTEAGFELEAERRFDIEVPAPLSPKALRYAEVTFERARQMMADRLSSEDLAALGTASAATVRAARTAWVGRKR